MEQKNTIKSIISIRWKLTSNISDISNKLSEIPNLSKYIDGDEKFYHLKDEKITSSLIISKSKISIEYYSDNLRNENRKKMLIQILIFIKILKDKCEIDYDDLFKEIIDVLYFVFELERDNYKLEKYNDMLTNFNYINLDLYKKYSKLLENNRKLNSDIKEMIAISTKLIDLIPYSEENKEVYIRKIEQIGKK